MTEQQFQELLKTILQPALLLTAAGGFISLLTSYIWGFREWYAALPPEHKGLGQVLIVTVMVIGAGILSWTRVLAIVTPDTLGFLTLCASWLGAVMMNQGTYQATKNNQILKVSLIKESAYLGKVIADGKAELKE